MANSSLPSFDGSEYSVRARRSDYRPRRKIPVFVLAIIGAYIGFLAYYLVVEDALGLAPTTVETEAAVEPVGVATPTTAQKTT
ncbi:MAG: hypothetical protein AAFS13_06660 [Pseudomonadota bacterium]